ncbi:MAG: D-sedoheptulose 7-phosphate isomerase [Bacteroidales bacterium]|nr:D-sedoheptulose 7-phosphate isomerase [Bacteroidales bacterium]
MKELILKDLKEAQGELERFLADPATLDSIAQAANICADALQSGHKILSCGNGGSLCDATHFAEELTGRYRGNRRPLPAIAINDPAYLTCTANDFGYEYVFSRYVEGVGNAGDVLLAISTSGTSANVLKAAEAAKAKEMKVVALTGPSGNPLAEMADTAVCAPAAPHSDRIQEIHIKVIHILIHAIEELL